MSKPRLRHPFSIITKGALITRDLDILGPMADQATTILTPESVPPSAGFGMNLGTVGLPMNTSA